MLTEKQQDELTGRIELLERHGPGLGRPVVDTITGSSLANLKELRARSEGSDLRVLFVFDPLRRAVLLLGGDKSGQWTKWYQRAIPRAEMRYQEYLESDQYTAEFDEHQRRQP
ncbi:MAG: type II toxin-antitoxin system RelE/ParE family toxin [Acidimicrobiia bacterium]